VPILDENGKLVSLEGIARDVTEAILAEQQIRRQLQQLSALRDIDTAITAHTAQKEVLGILLDSVTHLLGVDAADIYLLDASGAELQFAGGKGFRHEPAQSISLMSRKNYAGLVVQEQRTVRVSTSSVQTLEEGFTRMMVNEEFVSYVGTPLVTNDQVIGVLEVFHRMALQTDAEWINFFETLAGQAAIAIDNTGLIADLQTSNERLIQAYDLTLEGWVRALDLRDKETEGHTQRVAEMTLQLAIQMGFKEEELKSIRRGALLHDIGKIGIPDSILLKPGSLTDDEWVIMKKHPSFAYDLIHPIPYLSETLDIPYCHHEKWNGSGYPRGLKGEEIPLAARIFAAIDVWDALLSDRPYRKSWSKEKAIQYLQEQAGIHFDPAVVKVFIDWIGGQDAG
jgi:HD-GYP domain-containing protein (c-di-GMP phosphodiesterase class II)